MDDADFVHASARLVDDNVKLQARVRELEAELAPIKGLKAGLWQWAMVQLVMKQTVLNAAGHAFRMDRNGEIIMRPHGATTWTSVAFMQDSERFTLHVEPPEPPSADELCAAIEAIRNVAFAHTIHSDLWDQIKKSETLTARYRQRVADGR